MIPHLPSWDDEQGSAPTNREPRPSWEDGHRSASWHEQQPGSWEGGRDPVSWEDEQQPVLWDDGGNHAGHVDFHDDYVSYEDDDEADHDDYDDYDDYDEADYEALTRRERRNAKFRHRAEAREARWQRNRLAVPYRTDGPKITFGVIWFGLALGATIYSNLALTALLSFVTGLAGLQLGYAWFPRRPAAKWWTALAALVVVPTGLLGPTGIAGGCALGLMILLVYTLVDTNRARTIPELMDVLLRSSIPVGLAAAAMVGLAEAEPGAILSLIVLVSAYEVGDFLVGSGSSNAIEGPISGLVALGAALFILWIVAPTPFTSSSMLLFGALAAICCPLGQITASALLPRGNAWAPSLRRLDSYLLAAPLWLVLIDQATTATSL